MPSLLDCPLELWAIVCYQLPSKRDLSSLAQACRHAWHCTNNYLYETVFLNLALPPSEIHALRRGIASNSSLVKHVTVYGGLWPFSRNRILLWNMSHDTNDLRTLQLLRCIPKEQMRSFKWLVPGRLPPSALLYLSRMQRNLTNLTLTFYQYGSDESIYFEPLLSMSDKLQRLKITGISSQSTYTTIFKFMMRSKELKRIALSTKFFASIGNSHSPRVSPSPPSPRLRVSETLPSFAWFSHLRSFPAHQGRPPSNPIPEKLRYESFKLRYMNTAHLEQVVDVRKLKSLTLVHCGSLHTLFPALTRIPSPEFQLKIFRIHLLESDRITYQYVEGFVQHISGLVEFLLFAEFFVDASSYLKMLATHRKTLQSVSFDIKQGDGSFQVLLPQPHDSVCSLPRLVYISLRVNPLLCDSPQGIWHPGVARWMSRSTWVRVRRTTDDYLHGNWSIATRTVKNAIDSLPPNSKPDDLLLSFVIVESWAQDCVEDYEPVRLSTDYEVFHVQAKDVQEDNDGVHGSALAPHIRKLDRVELDLVFERYSSERAIKGLRKILLSPVCASGTNTKYT